MRWSVTLTDRLGPEMLTVLEIKGQVLHRVRLHVKVPGLLLNLNTLLTKKLPKFLSRLNEMSGGKENMCLVSGSLLRILKFLRMTFLIARFCGFLRFVVRSLGRFLGRGVCLWLQRSQGSRVF